jgi:cyclophilin family peptidyl-prolyl cis-trans isomerase
MIAMGMALVLVLAGITVANSAKPVAVGDVVMELSWTDTSGQSHNGKIWIELYEDDTPMHAESFRSNTDAGRYDGTIFHRIVDGFMIQGGDFENGDGTGGHAGKYFGYCASTGFSESDTCENDMTDWVVPAEFGETHSPGVIAAARSQADNSAGSQFYLVDSTGATSLDNQYTAFGFAYKGEIDGSATTGVAVIDAISQVGCGANQDVCTDNNKLSTYPVTVESAVISGVSEANPWYQFW